MRASGKCIERKTNEQERLEHTYLNLEEEVSSRTRKDLGKADMLCTWCSNISDTRLLLVRFCGGLFMIYKFSEPRTVLVFMGSSTLLTSSNYLYLTGSTRSKAGGTDVAITNCLSIVAFGFAFASAVSVNQTAAPFYGNWNCSKVASWSKRSNGLFGTLVFSKKKKIRRGL